MGVGLEVIGDSGSVLIDANWINYALVSVTTINSRNQNNIAPVFTGATLSDMLEGDLVFVHCTSVFAVVGLRFVENVRCHSVATFAVGVPVTFYVFRKQPPTDSKFGMQVFSATGELIFDAASKFVRVDGSVPASDIYLARDYALGLKKYAVLLPSFCGQIVTNWFTSGAGGQFPWFQQIDVYAPSAQVFANGVRTLGQRAIASQTIPDTTGRPTQVTTARPVQMLIANVTGF